VFLNPAAKPSSALCRLQPDEFAVPASGFGDRRQSKPNARMIHLGGHRVPAFDRAPFLEHGSKQRFSSGDSASDGSPQGLAGIRKGDLQWKDPLA